MSQRIPLNLASPGMVVAAEVKDEQGRTLCGPGTELTAELLDKFERLGVKFITVEGHPINFPWERPLEEDLKLLEARFAKVRNDPHLTLLKEVIRRHWLEKRADERDQTSDKKEA